MKIKVKYITLLLAFLFIIVPHNAAELTTDDFIGTWKLIYSGGYGYEYRFKNNYRAYVIVYLRSSVVVFRGIYAVDEGTVIRINISEMKEQTSRSNLEADKDFQETASTVFLFKVKNKKKDSMTFLPKKIHIDGRPSEGYFEDAINLKKK
jgi:hypothetical protein